ncbi:MAG TPA: FHA domain-containing protein [Polyangiaceae bacterium]|nr:FHA domain-containing protein [Polyangiaceae bacterium]
MALTVVVRSAEGTSAPRITFDAPRIVIGRGEGCEVRLPDPSVSHRHASIRQRGADYIVMDEGSTNGTFVGPVKLSPGAPRVLRSGDLIRIGRVWLETIVEQALPTQNGPVATRELALRLVAEALAAEGSASAVRVQVVEGPGTGAELVLDDPERPYVVGRAKAADLDVDDPDLSRRHVEILRRGGQVVVRDLGSKNGSFLDDQKVPENGEAPWPKNAKLVIGKTALAYEDPVAAAFEELERAADEKIPASEEPPMPKGETPEAPIPTDTFQTSSKPGTPVAPRPKRAPPPDPGTSWTAMDVLVAFLALVVLVLSVAALVWLMKSG